MAVTPRIGIMTARLTAVMLSRLLGRLLIRAGISVITGLAAIEHAGFKAEFDKAANNYLCNWLGSTLAKSQKLVAKICAVS